MKRYFLVMTSLVFFLVMVTLSFAVVGEALDEEGPGVYGVDIASDSVILRFQRTNQAAIISVGTRVGPADT